MLKNKQAKAPLQGNLFGCGEPPAGAHEHLATGRYLSEQEIASIEAFIRRSLPEQPWLTAARLIEALHQTKGMRWEQFLRIPWNDAQETPDEREEHRRLLFQFALTFESCFGPMRPPLVFFVSRATTMGWIPEALRIGRFDAAGWRLFGSDKIPEFRFSDSTWHG